MVDSEQPRAHPPACAVRRKLQQLERMSFRVAELRCSGDAGRRREFHGTVSGDRPATDCEHVLPGSLDVVGDERTVLKAKIGGRGVDGIIPSRSLEGIEIDPLLAEAKRYPDAAARQTQERDLIGSYGLGLTHAEAELLIER